MYVRQDSRTYHVIGIEGISGSRRSRIHCTCHARSSLHCPSKRLHSRSGHPCRGRQRENGGCEAFLGGFRPGLSSHDCTIHLVWVGLLIGGQTGAKGGPEGFSAEDARRLSLDRPLSAWNLSASKLANKTVVVSTCEDVFALLVSESPRPTGRPMRGRVQLEPVHPLCGVSSGKDHPAA